MESLYIKNMVCERCITVVESIFLANGVKPLRLLLGEVHVESKMNDIDLVEIAHDLEGHGFELIDQSSPILVLKIKAALTELFSNHEIPDDFRLSSFLSKKFPYDYSHMSRIFSSHEDDTIEHFIIKLRIEKAKELLSYQEHNISEIAYKIGYASAAHFSRQFKKMVGDSPSDYRKNPSPRQSLARL